MKLCCLGKLPHFFIGMPLACLTRFICVIFHRRNQINILADSNNSFLLEATKKRVHFYLHEFLMYQNAKIIILNKLTIKQFLSLNPILLLNYNAKKPWYARYCKNIYRINDEIDASACDSWHIVSNDYQRKKFSQKEEFNKFNDVVKKLQKSKRKEKVYLIGTGPSATSAISRDWSDGYVFSCNTIVKDKKLFDHIHPDIIVGNDPIYHFGNSSFAQAYQKDVYRRMKENPDLFFIYPAIYYSICNRIFADFKDRLIGIPHNTLKKDVSISLLEDFSYPCYRNALIHQLLPLACTFSKNIFLWGFDGRAPSDQLFWNNAEPITYSEYLPELIRDNPAFFNQNVPKEDPGQYSRMQNDMLTEVLQIAEAHNFHFTMMHKSWTPILQAHFNPSMKGVQN